MRDHVGAAEVLSVLRVVSSYNSLTDELSDLGWGYTARFCCHIDRFRLNITDCVGINELSSPAVLTFLWTCLEWAPQYLFLHTRRRSCLYCTARRLSLWRKKVRVSLPVLGQASLVALTSWSLPTRKCLTELTMSHLLGFGYRMKMQWGALHVCSDWSSHCHRPRGLGWLAFQHSLYPSSSSAVRLIRRCW